mmetsp:Transcript_653/g.806  ORF Transcript_653/g.806 Transcript_653/m.806 type:complete len:347 (-) Transcript_653:370-1410(-)|eukprot:CAMPEP_0195308076 /NCGR_PEP_ID=MMETSP0707-20130614/38039_1 /TAXON_ID=33640 /ORGANISM="Asterionellopsis glacialis, Strain CCMP134" /LENGTH=346 /DNA_ID=CAMNT_0040372335 /DNA_START=2366 /DNA_END=3406 /DNA_ORIENTATION=-
MKYLEDEKLTQMTSTLTDAVLGGANCRVINGRLEAYTMKRAGTEKKYAHALSDRYAHEVEQMDDEFSSYQQYLQRHNGKNVLSISPPDKSRLSSWPQERGGRSGRKRSQSVGTHVEVTKNIKHRKRASSFDASPNKHGLPSALSSKQRGSAPLLLQQSALGDFHDMGTRKLMTDLILTLNASFPDYDFANVRPSHFSKVPTSSALHRINERLSELAASEEHASNLLSNLWNAMDGCIALSECMVYSYVPTDATAEDDDPLNFLTQTLAGEDASSLWSFNYFFVNKHAKRIVLFTCVESILPQGDVVNEGGDFFVTKGMGYNTDASDVDFDLDPAADVAGGIPVATR